MTIVNHRTSHLGRAAAADCRAALRCQEEQSA